MPRPTTGAAGNARWRRGPRGTLLLFDAGLLNYARFDQLTEDEVWFLTRPASTTAYRVGRALPAAPGCRDLLVWLGSRKGQRCARLMRLIEVGHRGKASRSLTRCTDPQALPVARAAARYGERRRVEDAFSATKRLLGLADFWVGAANRVHVQRWVTWRLYAALVDLTDAVAEALAVPLQEVSREMTYHRLYHCTQAYQRGEADDPVAYLAAKATRLGLRTRKRRPAPTATPP